MRPSAFVDGDLEVIFSNRITIFELCRMLKKIPGTNHDTTADFEKGLQIYFTVTDELADITTDRRIHND